MKKCLLLLAAGLLSVGASAQTETLKVTMPSNPWNVSAIASSTKVTFVKQYGEYILLPSTVSSISKTAYTGVKVEFADANGNLQLVVGKGESVDAKNLSEYPGGVIEYTFPEWIDNEITSLNVKDLDGNGSITIKKVTLIKTGGAEEVVTTYKGDAWSGTGTTVAQEGVSGLYFTGANGFADITTADGSACTYNPTDEAKVVYTYNVELEEAATGSIYFEVRNESGNGFIWQNIEAGKTSLTFTVSAQTCSQVMGSLQVKSSTSDPFAVKFKSITRTKVVNKTADDYEKSYTIPLTEVNGKKIILSKYLSKFDDDDLAIFSYSCSWTNTTVDFNNWGCAGLYKGDDLKTVVEPQMTCGTKPGTYTASWTVSALSALVGHHSAEEATDENPTPDTSEWDGVLWGTWLLEHYTDANIVATTTLGDLVICTNKTVDLDKEEDPKALRPAATADVVSTVYYNALGQKSATPFRGVNIVKQALSDGSTRTLKVLSK